MILQAKKLAIARSVFDDQRCRSRAETIAESLVAEQTEIINDDAIDKLLGGIGQRRDLERGGLKGRAGVKELVLLRRGGEEIFPGYGWQELRSSQHERTVNDVLCHSAIEIQSAVGCPFDCTYCPYTAFVSLRVDVEAFVDQVSTLATTCRSQTLFKLNNRTDTLGLEPEVGLAPALVERFATLPGKYLLLYAKGDHVDGLLDLDHRGKTVASFTLTPEPVAQLLECGAPKPEARLHAIARLQAAGYPIRVRFSPIVPVRGWQEMYAQLIADLAQVSHPEMVTLWTLSMIELPELFAIVPEKALDPEALVSCRDTATSMRGKKGAPFPPALRAQIYYQIATQVRTQIPNAAISLCLENAEVWDAVGDPLVPRRRTQFACNCGPQVTPAVVSRLRAADAQDQGIEPKSADRLSND